MSVYTSNIIINSGADFTTTFELSDASGSALNLTNYSGVSHLRKTYSSSTYVGFAVSFVSPANGKVSIGLTSGQTSGLKPGRYVYDVLLTDGSGTKTRVVEGMALVREGVTK